ncbi:MAG: methyltransferase regulatory domain-containing protein [Gemmataceae bacterium]
MSDSLAASYDRVPYDSRPRYATHPDCLATLGTLLGMKPAPVERCRVLELGCSTGGNLLPLAETYPGSRFTGWDLSSSQIETGRKVAHALGLTNLTFEARNLLEIEGKIGEFDYIICHGVYSWVPEAVRDKILSLCKTLLAPQGIAYVSYNTYPGWYLRSGVRDLMNFHTREIADPGEKVRQARGIVDFFLDHSSDPDNTWSRALRDEAEVIRPEGDYYVFHEHLEEHNHAVYFWQFVEHARRHGLHYLGEAQSHATLSAYPPDVQEYLRNVSRDLLHLEQYLDFMKNRMFRRTLLVHEAVPLNRQPGPEVVEPLFASGMARPVSPDPEVLTDRVEEFVNEDGATVSTPLPFAKAILLTLFERWPEALSFSDLLEAVGERIGDLAKAMTLAQAQGFLARSLAHLYLSNMVGLHTIKPSFTLHPWERPLAPALIRLQAKTGAKVCNRRHKLVPLSVFDRALLSLCDGKTSRTGLSEQLARMVQMGEVELQREGVPVTELGKIREAVSQEIEPGLERLARSMVLIA